MLSAGRGLGRRLVLLGTVLTAAALAGSAFARTGANSPIREGGTLRVNVTGTDFAPLDPAINYDTDGAQLLYATCAKLVNYPDRPAPAGSLLVPEVADAMPTVSRDGRTYTFRISHEYRFGATSIHGCTLRRCSSCGTWRRSRRTGPC